MSPLMAKIVVIVAAIAVIAPTTYFIIVQQRTDHVQNNPYNYVPAGSSFVAQVHLNSTQIYIFGYNGSFGVILPFPMSDLQLISNVSLSNASAGISISEYITYESEQLYSIQNLNLSSFIGGFSLLGSGYTSLPFTIPDMFNGTIYAAGAGGAMTVAGNLSAVEYSINSSKSGDNFISTGNQYMDDSSNYSFYYTPSNISKVNFISGNISNGYTHIYVSLANNTIQNSFHYDWNGTYNISISGKHGAISITVTGNYTVNELVGYLSGYLSKAGLA